MESPRVQHDVAGTIAGRYAIDGLIGSGGMGEVYRARDTVLGRSVALKVLRGRFAADPQFVERFRTEATNAAGLSHPGIVQVYDFGRDGELAYMALELVSGTTLRDLLSEKKRLEPHAAAEIAAEVCSALDHARRAGIVHRDIKPENVLITGDGRVKVADFGLSRALADARATNAGTVLGTAAYLAPEQINGRPSDHRADIYALGLVLFEMITGRVPFSGDSPAAVAYRRLGQDVPAPSTVNPNIPPALDQIVARATAREPANRYPTPAAMGAALRALGARAPAEPAAVKHETIAIPVDVHETIALPARPEKSGRRRKLIALLALLILAGVLVPVVRSVAKIEVPSVRAMTQGRAKAALERAGLKADVELAKHPTVPETFVIGQRPAAGDHARRGSRVTIIVSLGPELIAVRDVVDISFATAKRTLARAGFKVERVDGYSDTIARGKVIAQDPSPRVRIERGEVVTLTVSKGRELVFVPNVDGKPEGAARAALTDAGLVPTVIRKYSATVPAGIVVQQTPLGGNKASKGSTVSLLVSNGPPPVVVPDLRCLTTRQAADALAAKGLKVDFSGRGKKVVDQSPAPGDQAPRGSTVIAYLGRGVYC
jgi:eukaryotic-like serine/threonine-protein kinase